MTNLPVIFIHKGYSSYLEYSLRQAKNVCPDSEIILLGDNSNNTFDFITHIDIASISDTSKVFSKYYQHCSTNPYNYELFCFQRWFILEEYLRKNPNHNDCFVCDSDVLLYSDLNKLSGKYWTDIDLGLIISSPGKYSVGISYWKHNCLLNFCSYMLKQYKNPAKFKKIDLHWQKIKASGKPGSYCDMCAVESFFNDMKTKYNFFNLVKAQDNRTFDFHINIPHCWEHDIYQFKNGIKLFIWKNGIPFCLHLSKQNLIKFDCIHFQGPAKYLMQRFYTGPKFKGKIKLDLTFFVLNIIAYWYKVLKIRYRFAFIFNYFNSKKQ